MAQAGDTPGLDIQGALVVLELAPGQTYVHTITVGTQSNIPLEMKAEVAGLGQTIDGSAVALTSSEDMSPYSARSFVNIDKNSFHLEQGTTQEVKVTITVPQGTLPGERYATVHLESAPTAQDKVGVIVASNIPIILTIPGATPNHIGQITSLTVPQSETGKPIQVETVFKNNGTFRIPAKNQITITDEAGQVLGQSETLVTSPSIIPTFSRAFMVTPTFSGTNNTLNVGSYFVESKVTLEDGTILDSQKVGFNVTKAKPATSGAPPSTQLAPPNSTPTNGSDSPIPGISWAVAGIIIAGILVIGAVIITLVLTRRKKTTNG